MTLLNDLRMAVRVLLKDRRLTFSAGAAIALGIAATTTVFTIVNGALLRDMPFEEPERIVALEILNANGGNPGVSYLDARDLQSRTQTFSGIAAHSQRTMNVSEDQLAPERYQGALVTANTFSLLGHRPILGRDFSARDEQPGADPVVIIGYNTWQTRYNADPNVLNRTIRVNGVSSSVIGVMGERFKFPFSAEIWQPLSVLPAEDLSDRNRRFLQVFGRLGDSVTVSQASQDIARVLAGFEREYPETHADLTPRVAALRPGAGPEIRTVMIALLGAVAFLLLIACANVANLLLARSIDRSREVSVRMAIGATRWQIVRQLLTESLLLSTVSGLLGFALAVAGVRLFVSAVTGTGEPYWLDFSISPTVLMFFAAVCVGTAIVFGLVPALHTSNLNVSEMLNESSRGAGGGVRVRRWAGALVVLQLALAPVLLAGAGLMMRTLLQRFQVDPGIPTEGLVVMRLDLSDRRYQEEQTRIAFFRALDERLAASPGLRVALSSNAPTGGTPIRGVEIDGKRDAEGRLPDASFMSIGPRYFEAVGARLLRGRDITLSEPAGDIPALVNERFAELRLAGRDPIGTRIRVVPLGPQANAPNGPQPQWVTVVGVISNVRQRDLEDGNFDPILYIPYTAGGQRFVTLLARSDADVATVTTQVREGVGALDADLPIFDVRTLDEILYLDTWPFRVFGSMFATFAVIAFFLASLGLYAVTARSVAQRTREIGVRMALGAEGREIWWVVTRRATIQLAIGLVVGMAGAVAVGRLLLGVLVDVSPTDPVTFIGVPLLLAGVGVLAALVPARRAMRLNPVQALRHE